MSDENNSPVTQHQVIAEESTTGPKTQEEEKRQKALNTFSRKNTDGVNISVKVYSPSQVYYDGLAFSVTATNDTGEFDVLPKHHPFISLLNACDLVVRTVNEGNRKISISGGLIHVKEDKIIVFLDI
jgi:hypothetical protein